MQSGQTGTIANLTQDIENLRKLLDQLAPTLTMVNGTLQTLKPLLDLYFAIDAGVSQVTSALAADLADTPEMKREAVRLIENFHQYTEELNSYLNTIRNTKAFIEAKQLYPILSTEVTVRSSTTVMKDDKLSKTVGNIPQPPSSSELKKHQDAQQSFAKYSSIAGTVAIPSIRYMIQAGIFGPMFEPEEKNNVTKLEKAKRELASSASSDAATICTWSLLVAGIGNLTIKQDFLSGAQLGAKQALIMLALYEGFRIVKYATYETGINEYIPGLRSNKPK